MKYKKVFSLIAVLAVFFQFSCSTINTQHQLNTDFSMYFLTAYYDLRDRDSYIQVTNTSPVSITIHVQIFQHDRDCRELNFFDQLTPNDTVVYNMDDVRQNDGSEVGITLAEDSYGYVVVSTSNGIFDSEEQGSKTALENFFTALIGNFRIIDNAGYEYRTNMASHGLFPLLDNLDEEIILTGDVDDDDEFPQIPATPMYANFNTVDGAILADVVGYAYVLDFGFDLEFGEGPVGLPEPEAASFADTVINFTPGVDFNVFVFDLDEDPLSCDRRNFACGKVMNYGINEDYRASRGNDLLCPGGGLADPKGGYIIFEDGIFPTYDISFT
ncbi:MAG: hypothetical protein GTO02_03925, partial [Candidatus Dadabacteria bacterium]|nr:hypothetical protein [Candidatus Dadabacteria bacterium]NIQ13574.1 hypothetical protein [Candidatus Dadabacteria bacterium]